MRRHKDETMDEFDARLATKNSKLNMAWLEPKKKRKSVSTELVDKIAKDVRKERKKREAAERLDERSFNAAEKEYAREYKNGSELASAVRTVEGTGLDLACLRIANIARSESKKGFDHPLDAWSVAEWANAMQAEAGEAGNVAKKLIRIRYKTKGNNKGDRSQVKLARQLAQEVADAVVYADLLLASEGISLSDAVRDTFNRKSKEIGFKFKL